MAQEAHEFINRNSEKKIGLNPDIINAIYYRNCVGKKYKKKTSY